MTIKEVNEMRRNGLGNYEKEKVIRCIHNN